MWRPGMLLAAVCAIGCSRAEDQTGFQFSELSRRPPYQHPASKVVADDRPAFRIDSDESYRIEFGRGSGLDGLETIKITNDGRVILHRLKSRLRNDVIDVSWWSTEIQLTKEELASLVETIERNKLTTLAKAYHADVADGTQWVLWIKQGDREKSVYCDNHFPEPILTFADRIDEILALPGRNLAWRKVPWDRSHDKDLWDSIKR